jgi:hypothetical protein
VALIASGLGVAPLAQAAQPQPAEVPSQPAQVQALPAEAQSLLPAEVQSQPAEIDVVPADASVQVSQVQPSRLQPPDPIETVFGTPKPVIPDVAYSVTNKATGGKGRVEIYTSIGQTDGGMDWRTSNALAWLIYSVPKKQYIYAAIYNTWWDSYRARRNKTTNKFDIYDPSGKKTTQGPTFTMALAKQMNYYSSDAERQKYIWTVGQRDKIKLAKKTGSSLTDLVVDTGTILLCSKKGGGCVPNESARDMHSKFAFFSQTRDSNGKLWNDVAWVTTGNLNGTSGGKTVNTAVAVYGDAKLYKEFVTKVVSAMKAQKVTSAYRTIMTTGIKGDLAGVTYIASPRKLTSSGYKDHETEAMKSLVNAKKKSCKVRVLNAMFSAARQKFADYMVKAKSQGCSVRLILDEDFVKETTMVYLTMNKSLRKALKNVAYANIHEKTIAISNNGKYSFFTGSANLNGPALTSDESVIRLDHKQAVDAEIAHADWVWNKAKKGSTKVKVAKVTLSGASPDLYLDETMQLKATIAPSKASNKEIRWTSSNSAVAKVSSKGLVTPVKPGKVTITATSFQGGKRASATIEVLKNNVVPRPTLKASTTATRIGQQATLSVSWSNGVAYKGKAELYSLDVNTGREIWNKQADLNINNGSATYTYTVKGSVSWQVRMVSVSSPADLVVRTEEQFYSNVAAVLGVTTDNPATPVLYVPTRAPAGQQITVVAQWDSPAAPAKPAQLRLQYRDDDGKWQTKTTFTMTSTIRKMGLKVSATHPWRLQTTSKSGVSAVSKTVYIYTLGTTVIPKPQLSADPTTFKAGQKVKFSATWRNPWRDSMTGTLKLQYYFNGKWKTKTTITIKKNQTEGSVSVALKGSYKWRVLATESSIPDGFNPPVSASIKVTAS